MKKFGILLLLLGIFAFVGCPKQDAAPVEGDPAAAGIGDPMIEDPAGTGPAVEGAETPAEGSGAPAEPAANP